MYSTPFCCCFGVSGAHPIAAPLDRGCGPPVDEKLSACLLRPRAVPMLATQVTLYLRLTGVLGSTPWWLVLLPSYLPLALFWALVGAAIVIAFFIMCLSCICGGGGLFGSD